MCPGQRSICPRDGDPYSETVYAKAVENFDRLKREAPLVVEDTASLYVYRLRMGEVTQTGVAACFSLDEYDRDVDQETRADAAGQGGRPHAAPGCPARADRASVSDSRRGRRDRSRRGAGRERERRSTTSPRRRRVSTRSGAWMRRRAGAHRRPLAVCRALYIADGHHRAASAARARQQLRGHASTPGEWDTFLAVAFPAPQVRSFPTTGS